MSWAPVAICGSLITITYSLVEFADWDAKLAGLAVVASTLVLVGLVGGACMLFLPAADRTAFRRAVFATAKKDLTDISDHLTFRR